MPDINELNAQFAIPDTVKFEPGEGNLPRITITTPTADAHVYLHGAHVTHYQPHDQKPVLFMSGKSHFAPDKPIRGGVPLIFPWFGPRANAPAAPAHGFARAMEWHPRQIKPTAAGVGLTLALQSSDATKRYLPNDFELLYTVTIGATLDLALEVRNRSTTPFTFEEAFHTYLTVGDVRQTTIEGLAGRTYIDKTDGMRRKTQTGPIRIESETDRVYLDTQETVTAIDPVLGRQLSVAKTGSNATVIWNPWIAKAKAMADFGDDEWPHMLCIETANVAENAVTLQPAQSHVMAASIAAIRNA
jgi:glucose-6-phosphate 1-epimerase